MDVVFQLFAARRRQMDFLSSVADHIGGALLAVRSLGHDRHRKTTPDSQSFRRREGK